MNSNCPATPKRKFLADKMVGRLATWLRLLGYDTAYAPKASDSELLALAEAEGRILLTRDTALIRRKRCPEYIFIRSDHRREQLKQVYDEAGLDCESVLSRCPVCNVPLHPVEKQSVRQQVPPYVYKTQQRFYRCDKCSRIFWPATHVTHILEELEKLREDK